jgi:ssRNA-specific RNase YbeY (16S rRNA maturation enzyme)
MCNECLISTVQFPIFDRYSTHEAAQIAAHSIAHVIGIKHEEKDAMAECSCGNAQCLMSDVIG